MIGVVVSAEVAQRLAPGLRALRRALEYDNGQRLDPAVEATLRDIEALARAHRNTMTEHNGTSGIPATSQCDTTIDVIEAATFLGCSPRNIRALAERGTLRGRKVAGRWRFDRLDIAARKDES